MNPEQQRAILTTALLAAFADGAKHDREREEIRRIAASLMGAAGAPDLARLYQDVLLKRARLDEAVAALDGPELRQLAFEIAVCVCDADGRLSAAEQRFLNELKTLLKLDVGQAAAFEREADVIVELTEAAAPVAVAGAAAVAAAPGPVGGGAAERGRGGLRDRRQCRGVGSGAIAATVLFLSARNAVPT